MAAPHCKVKSGSRNGGQSAKAHFNYICRSGRYERGDLVGVVHENYPTWATKPDDFWQAADLYERANGRLYTELEISLPRELTRQQQVKLIRDFVDQELGKDFPYTIAFHESKALDGKANPHVHMMFNERKLDGIERNERQYFKRGNSKHPEKGGTAKDRDWSRREKVRELRESWERAVNLALKRAGHHTVISMKSLSDQDIDRLPEPKLGAVQAAMVRQGKETEAIRQVQALREIRQLEASLEKVQAEIHQTVKNLAQEVCDLSVSVPASKVREEVREKKLGIYQELREVEQERFKLGLVRVPGKGEFYPSEPQLDKQQNLVEVRYQQLIEELKASKQYEKQLSLLGQEKIRINMGITLSDPEALIDRQSFLQKVKEVKVRILERNQTTNQIQLIREVPPP